MGLGGDEELGCVKCIDSVLKDIVAMSPREAIACGLGWYHGGKWEGECVGRMGLLNG